MFDIPYIWTNTASDANTEPTKITFSFVEDVNPRLFSSRYKIPNPNIDEIYAFNEHIRDATRSALKEFSKVANISFSEVEETKEQVGTIRFGFTDHPRTLENDNGSKELAWGWARAPSNLSDGGDIWISATQKEESFIKGKDYNFYAIMHEIGHALGLAHPFSGIDQLLPEQNFRNYSIMSYSTPENGHWYDEHDNFYYLISSTPMVFDIAAMQYLYGPAKYNFDDNIYEYDPKIPVVETIWDSGGIDTVNLSTFTKDAILSLIPGSYSTLHYSNWTMTHNLGIAHNTAIEHAVGGEGNDRINGNALDNHIIGGLGNDNIEGGSGNDTLDGGAGNDIIFGGAGDDLIIAGNGKDTLTGGLGSNVFEFKIGDGTNLINDFNVALDRVLFKDEHDQKISYADHFDLDEEVSFSLFDGTTVHLKDIFLQKHYVPDDGLYLEHEGSSLKIISAEDVKAAGNGISVVHMGTGSTTIEAQADITSGYYEAGVAADLNLSIGSDLDGINVINSDFNNNLVIFTRNVSGFDDGVSIVGNGTGNIVISSSGNISGTNSNGIKAINNSDLASINMSVNHVEGYEHGIFANSLGSTETNITVSGQVLATGINSKGIYVEGSSANINLLKSSKVIAAKIGIETGKGDDTTQLKGYVESSDGIAINLREGDDHLNLDESSSVNGLIFGGSGNDTVDFNFSKLDVESFFYEPSTDSINLILNNEEKIFKEFEFFKFQEDASRLETSVAVSRFADKTHTLSVEIHSRAGIPIADARIFVEHNDHKKTYVSNSDGEVEIFLPWGSSIKINASKNYEKSNNEINSYDALAALNIAADLLDPSQDEEFFTIISADFNQDGRVSSQDAFSIQKHALGLNTYSFPEWIFMDTNHDYSNIDRKNVIYDSEISIGELTEDTTISLTGILLGDVSDTFTQLIA